MAGNEKKIASLTKMWLYVLLDEFEVRHSDVDADMHTYYSQQSIQCIDRILTMLKRQKGGQSVISKHLLVRLEKSMKAEKGSLFLESLRGIERECDLGKSFKQKYVEKLSADLVKLKMVINEKERVTTGFSSQSMYRYRPENAGNTIPSNRFDDFVEGVIRQKFVDSKFEKIRDTIEDLCDWQSKLFRNTIRSLGCMYHYDTDVMEAVALQLDGVVESSEWAKNPCQETALKLLVAVFNELDHIDKNGPKKPEEPDPDYHEAVKLFRIHATSSIKTLTSSYIKNSFDLSSSGAMPGEVDAAQREAVDVLVHDFSYRSKYIVTDYARFSDMDCINGLIHFRFVQALYKRFSTFNFAVSIIDTIFHDCVKTYGMYIDPRCDIGEPVIMGENVTITNGVEVGSYCVIGTDVVLATANENDIIKIRPHSLVRAQTKVHGALEAPACSVVDGVPLYTVDEWSKPATVKELNRSDIHLEKISEMTKMKGGK